MLGQVADVFGVITGCWFIIEMGRKLNRRLKEHKSLSPDGQKERTARDYTLGLIYSTICALLWSLSYVSLSYISPRAELLEVNVILLGYSTIFLLVGSWIASLSRDEAINSLQVNANWSGVAPWIVTAANIASFLLFIYALHFISASQTITLQKINPVFVAIGTWLWLRHPPSRSTLSTVFLVVSGTFLITSNDQFAIAGGDEVKGSLFAVIAGAAFAAFSVAIESIERRESGLAGRLRFLSVVFFLSYVCIISVAHFDQKAATFDWEVMAILVLNGLRVAVVYALYYGAVRRIGALLASVIVALEVPLTMMWDRLLLQQSPSMRLVWGAAAILLGAISLAWERLPRSGRAEAAP